MGRSSRNCGSGAVAERRDIAVLGAEPTVGPLAKTTAARARQPGDAQTKQHEGCRYLADSPKVEALRRHLLLHDARKQVV